MHASLLFLLHAGSTRLFAASEPTSFPLEHTSVRVEITGPVAEMTIEQTFRNDHDSFLEATYVFPLQEDAAVDAAVLHVGDREIRAEIERRDEARKVYEKAREKGQTASLTEQERPNVFTQSVANIPPGQEVEVALHVVTPLDYSDGVYRFVLPLVVGPRFVPGNVSDAERISPPVAPTTASDDQGIANRVDVRLHAQMGFSLSRVESPSHPEAAVTLGGNGTVDLVIEGARADRDFVLDLEPGSEEPQVAFLGQDHHFTLLFEPPTSPEPDDVVPRELVFVVDTSGSMSGEPLDAVKVAMRAALSGLLPGDSFRIVSFSDSVSSFGSAALPATPENVARGQGWVEALEAGGGTFMNQGLLAAFEAPPETDARRGKRQRILCFMSDGFVGNDKEILATVADRAGDVRVFTFGVGSSVNRYLLEGMALEGRGVARIVLPSEDPAAAARDFCARIARPVLTEISVDWGDLDVTAVYPERLPDLYAGEPLRLVGSYKGEPGSVTIRGRRGDGRFEKVLDLGQAGGGTGLGTLWARARIAELDRQLHWGDDEDVAREITSTALRFRLLSAYTSFVAVERKIVNPAGYQLSVDQPLEIPQGVSFEGVFGETKRLDGSIGLSRPFTRPGDPLLTVEAPEDALDVAALLPWGEMVRLTWDAVRGRWYHRFLVPRDVADGAYDVKVFVTLAGGRVESFRQPITVDAAEPEFEVEAEWSTEGTVVRLLVEEPLRSFQIYPVGQPEKRVRADLRNVSQADRDMVELCLPGWYDDVVVVVKDAALNRESRVVSVGDRSGE
jgi:Ca-activated chloride channel homolog